MGADAYLFLRVMGDEVSGAAYTVSNHYVLKPNLGFYTKNKK